MAEYRKVSFLDDFELPAVTPDIVRQQLSRVGKIKSTTKKSPLDSMPLGDRLKYISSEVNKTLGRYRDFVKVIRDESEFNAYIDFAIEKGVIALDTETNNSLDPLTCKLMGLCLYIPNTKPVYVPVSHTKPNTDTLLDNQVSLSCISEAFKKLLNSNIKIIYHNGKFDIRVCYNVTGVYLPIWWDTMIAAQLLNENELARLKYQYKIHVDPTVGTYNIEKLFTGLPYAWVDPEIFALYAAIDSYDTYVLQQKQEEIMLSQDMKNLYKLFREIEIPVVRVVAKMEDDGITLDLNYLNKLSKIYKEKQEKCLNDLYSSLKPYKIQIDNYTRAGKLDDPINFDSSLQLSILLYDIMKMPNNDGRKSTDKETLESLDCDFTNLLLEYRHYTKMLSGFTESWPTYVSEKDNKIHATFNQMGEEDRNVRTGRFSSTKPNLQQIPSHEGILRMSFKASTDFNDVDVNNDTFSLKSCQEIQVISNGDVCWVFAKDLQVGNIILVNDNNADTYKQIYELNKVDDSIIITIS